MYNDMYSNEISVDDVIKFLFEAKQDKHAARILRVTEELKLLQGKLEAYYEIRMREAEQSIK